MVLMYVFIHLFFKHNLTTLLYNPSSFDPIVFKIILAETHKKAFIFYRLSEEIDRVLGMHMI